MLKAQLSGVKDKLRHVLEDQEQAQNEHRRASEDLHKTITALQERHQAALATKSAEHKSKLSELELEIRRHRDRTIALLAEKDKEVETLKAKLPERYETQYMTSYRGMTSQSSVESDDGSGSPVRHQAPQSLVEQDSTVSELLKRTSLGGGGGVGTGMVETSNLLHFAQEQARKDVEINMLRKQKHSLESAMRDLQRAGATKEEKHRDAMEELEDKIRRLQRMTAREDPANLEYLKNVIYQYMVCQDGAGKKSMLNAIATILQFSPQEKNSVKQLLSSAWWSGVGYTSSRKGPTTRI